LASSEKQVDFKAAVKAIPGLGTEHRAAGRLRQTFQEAAEKRGFQLNERAAKQLAEAKVKVSKKSVKKGVWGQVRDLFR
jgi:protein-tyrosine-phosphatase